ncbi:MAG: hypothetical protein WCH58_00255 [Candidatus Saccharibacteria bacterium]
MFLVGILSWWYGNGWLSRLQMIQDRLTASADFFSIRSLLLSLFAPYKQISAGSIDGPINVKFQAFLDRLISRVIGSIVRSLVIIAGLIILIAEFVFGAILLALWFIVPFLPAIGFIIALIGWVPTR